MKIFLLFFYAFFCLTESALASKICKDLPLKISLIAPGGYPYFTKQIENFTLPTPNGPPLMYLEPQPLPLELHESYGDLWSIQSTYLLKKIFITAFSVDGKKTFSTIDFQKKEAQELVGNDGSIEYLLAEDKTKSCTFSVPKEPLPSSGPYTYDIFSSPPRIHILSIEIRAEFESNPTLYSPPLAIPVTIIQSDTE